MMMLVMWLLVHGRVSLMEALSEIRVADTCLHRVGLLEVPSVLAA